MIFLYKIREGLQKSFALKQDLAMFMGMALHRAKLISITNSASFSFTFSQLEILRRLKEFFSLHTQQ